MKSLTKTLVLLVMFLAVAIAELASASPSKEVMFFEHDKNASSPNSNHHAPYTQTQKQASLKGNSRFFYHMPPRFAMRCNKYPRVCHVKGSPGPDCCKKRCVNVLTDRLNCGTCVKKCKFPEICCNGKCVNPMFNKWHCGTCSNLCEKGSSCVFGMCSYA